MEGRIDYSFIEKCLKNRISFAAFTLPNQKQFSMMIQKAAYPIKINPRDDLSKLNGFLIAPFDLSISSKLFIQNDFVLTENETHFEACHFVQNTIHRVKDSSDLAFNTSHETYNNQFEKCLSLMKKNRTQKIVLSRVVSAYKKAENPISEIFRSINQSYPSSFNYLLYTPNSGIWMGATPEKLLRLDEDIASTVALAGTQTRRERPDHKYEWGDKEKLEQKIVVDFVESGIKKHLHGDQLKKHTKTILAAKAAHLETTFKFDAFHLIEKLNDFLDDLHPTPAVCGFPKLAVLKFIREIEDHDRELYAGFLGPINIHQKTDLFVNLRCLKAKGNSMSLFVGGGLTLESEAQSEWDETSLKAKTLLSFIN
jgi:isochorismate synthase